MEVEDGVVSTPLLGVVSTELTGVVSTALIGVVPSEIVVNLTVVVVTLTAM